MGGKGETKKGGRGDGEGGERKGRGRSRGKKGGGVHYRKDCLMLFPDNPDKKNILDKNKSFKREMLSRTLTLPCKKRKKMI